jgi:hypothetical protein
MDNVENCRAYVEHLHQEHARLNQLLLQIGRDVADLSPPDDQPVRITRVAARLAELRSTVQAHYAEEESGGCIEEAVTRSPSLASNAKAILEEHVVLDRMLEQWPANLARPLTIVPLQDVAYPGLAVHPGHGREDSSAEYHPDVRGAPGASANRSKSQLRLAGWLAALRLRYELCP